LPCRAHARTLTRHGYAITDQQVLERFLGVSDREARATIEAEIGRKLPDDYEAEIKDTILNSYGRDDSVPGITGALAAGMRVLGFHGGSHCRPGYAEKLRAAGAHMTFDDMRRLPALIAAEVTGRSFNS
jgi:hypothetical protein